jgi:multiple sugar transport system ATP-binding protein
MKKKKLTEVDKAVNQTADLIGLKDLLNRKPRQLSGGQRQRVALGRALIREPKLFLFDEPLSNLDFNLRLNLRWEIAELQKKTGITSIYVTHDQQEALALGHRIGILKDGKMIQCCPPDELYSKPANLFIARFIGIPQINVLDGFIDENQDLSLHLNSGSTHLSNSDIPFDYKNEKCKIGIRAHYFNVSEVKIGKKELLELKAELLRIENQGDYYLGEFQYNDQKVLVKISECTDLKIGRSYYLTVNSENILLFHNSSENRIYPI